MNTTPTTFDTSLPAYTAVGGKARLASTGLSAVLLNRGGGFSRRQLFETFEKTGFDYVLSMESVPERYDLEELSLRFPFVRFILIPRGLSPGEQINLGARELSSPLFFVLWNDLKLVTGGEAGRMVERLCLSQEELDEAGAKAKEQGKQEPPSRFRRLCTVPGILNNRFETHPTLIAPVLYRRNVRTLAFVPRREGLPSLYPFDGVGIYDRERFINLGGYDSRITNPHWQLMDFGFRAFLWGEEIRVTQYIKLFCEGPVPVSDSTVDAGYRRFYLKNIAPMFRSDHARLPWRRFPAYLSSSGWDMVGAWGEFSEAGRWVRDNASKWHCDARTLNERWEKVDFDAEDSP
ncbi:MAG: hypothetical protein LBU00_06900 [Treponema sp.]|jgi:hypothetical protein|nr:hypothetical protein [Treponema sp.]